MSTPCPNSPEEAIAQSAARWIVRRDRGLSAAESIEYELWLAADPRHAEAMRRAGGAWSRLDHLPDELARRVLDQSRRRRRWWRMLAAAPLAAAAALVIVMLSPGNDEPAKSPPPVHVPMTLQAAGPRLLALADGTEVRLNAGSEIVERFSATERAVELRRGEAHFAVAKDPRKPFVVSAGALRVRAIGTAFNVSRQEARLEVLVTEGRVELLAADAGRRTEDGKGNTPEAVPRQSDTVPSTGENVRGEDTAQTTDEHGHAMRAANEQTGEGRRARPLAELGAGERASVSVAESGAGDTALEVAIAKVDSTEISRTLAWQQTLLRLGGATLAEIAAEFERRTGIRVVLADPALAQVRLGGQFRPDDADAFVKLLSAMLEVEAERGADGAIVLRKKK